ncbi:MAG: putative drug exporter of the superfamily, partial [Thermoleophilales bacterium]|nr:putative drug exporter of the superfamily [Thermoleophilales bacterium]
MRQLATFAYDRRRLVVAAWIASIAAAAALAVGAGGGFVNNFTLPGTESQRALDLLKQRFPQQSGDSSQIVFAVRDGRLTDAQRRAQVAGVVQRVQRLPHVTAVESPYAGPGAVSRDGRVAFATVLFDKQASALNKPDVHRVVNTAHAGATHGLQVELGGQAIEQAEQSPTGITELVGVAVAVVVLVFVLGSLVAMTMPLIVAFAGIALAMALVFAASAIFNIADFAPTLAVMIALGVGIDYALLIISRFRSERAAGADVRAATMTAMDTAGRSVLFAGSTVVVALLGMLLLGISFLNGPAIAAALAVLLTMVGSLTLLPALLGAFGGRVKAPVVADGDDESPRWARFSALIERRPRAFAVAATVLLLVVAVPVTGMRLGSSDAGSNPKSSTTRKAYDLLSQGFGAGFNGPFLVVAEVQGGAGRAELGRLATKLRAQPGVAAVAPPVYNRARDTATLTLFPASKPQDAATKNLLARLRSDVVPRHGPVSVSIGGSTASTVDMSSVLSSKLPLFVLVVVGLALFLLAVVFRSLVIPAKAAVMNLLSIGAALGVVTFVFQQGHLASLVGVDSTGPIEPFIPVFMFAIVFGLSMDYEVFLVTRMHE